MTLFDNFLFNTEVQTTLHGPGMALRASGFWGSQNI